MEFRIADTFTDSLAQLTGDEQKAVKTTVFDLQVDPTNPGHSFHKLDKAKDKNFWSVRVSRDIRIIVHKTQNSLLLCYVDHHDKAYDWAERRKLETHPTTGAAQLVQIRETVQEIVIPAYVEAPVRALVQLPLFAHVAREELLSYGVPEEWLKDVSAATEDSYLTLAEHLPAEAAEALLQLATGGKPLARVTTAALINSTITSRLAIFAGPICALNNRTPIASIECTSMRSIRRGSLYTSRFNLLSSALARMSENVPSNTRASG